MNTTTTKRRGRPRKTIKTAVTDAKTVIGFKRPKNTEPTILKDIDIALNCIIPKVAKGVLNATEANAMLRILTHLKVQSKVKPASFKNETY